MKSKLLLSFFMVSLFFVACSSRYKTAQTPDDMYYSEPVAKEETSSNSDEDTSKYFDDYYLQHKVRNRNQWNQIDDYAYWNDSRYFTYNNWRFYNGSNNDLGYSPFSYNNNYCYGCGYNGWYGNYYNNYSSWTNWNYGYNSWNSYNNWYGGYYNSYYGYYNWYRPYMGYNFIPNRQSSLKSFSSNKTSPYYNDKYNNTNYKPSLGNAPRQGINRSEDKKHTIIRELPNGETIGNPSRTFTNPSTPPSSSAGGNSGGFNSKGSTTGKPRG